MTSPDTPGVRFFKVSITAAFTLAVLAVAWVMAADVPVRYSMDCDRLSETCLIQQDRLVGQRSSYFSLASLRDVRVRPIRPIRGGQTRVSLIVRTDHGPYFVADYGPGQLALAQADATRISNLLRDPGDAEVHIVREADVSYWLGAIVLIVVLAMLACVWTSVWHDVSSARAPAAMAN